MQTINASLEDIRPICNPLHPANTARVNAIIESLKIGEDSYGDAIYREWDLPPVVVMDNEGNGYTPFDGHHRLAAAKKLGLATIPAWVVSIPDYCHLIESEFDGEMPNRMYDLRERIVCGDVDANNVAEHGPDVVGNW